MGAEMTELMYERTAADNGEVVDLNLTGNLCGIGNNHVVADNTVVGNVGVCHYQAIVSYAC